MAFNLIDLKLKDNSLKEFVYSTRQGIPSAVFGVSDSFKPFMISCIDYPVLYIVKDFITASSVKTLIGEYTNKKAVYIPPKDETLLSVKAFSRDVEYSRICALKGAKEADIIVTTIEALMQIVPKNVASLTLEKDTPFDRSMAVEKLLSMGYTRVEATEGKGSFSVRGDVIDVFPINSEVPVRIDFFGDTIENIKKFDIETRKNLGFIDSVEIISATEFDFCDVEFPIFKNTMRKEVLSADKNAKTKIKVLEDDLLTAMELGDRQSLFPLAVLSKERATLFDYLKENTVIVFDEIKRIYDNAQLLEREFTERYSALLQDGSVFSFAKDNFIGIDEFTKKIKEYRLSALSTISTAIPFFNPLKIINPSCGGISNYQLDFKEVFTDIKNWKISGYKVLIYAGSENKRETLRSDLEDRDIFTSTDINSIDKSVVVLAESLEKGFIFHEEKLAVIGSGNLFNKPVSTRKIKVKKQGFFTAPEKGDYCVHEIHGIGRVLGNKKISSTEGTKDYVSVEYSGGDILYVPVEQMDILTRYLGGEKKPKLSKIGGADFERIKRAVRESIKKMSFDLKKLYSERKEEKGFKFICDAELENAFDSAFPFEETPDQVSADNEIKEDMESGCIMDRLICGDVGFGKTEVAFRAVFRAIANGKQVAMLAPTTILTEQHYNTAVERFKDFGIKIAVLNRFKSTAEQKKIVQKVKDGEIDFIIGTHRLLSKDIGFKDLGLLVLDEEQRFGVEHKEKIKLLKENVDTLTLSATPIPRTLHMSLSGIRSISVINTPPKKRLPVQTYVTEESDMLIRDAVMREIGRGGQTFILYNRVESIYTFAEKIKAFLPNVRITVVHGQMDEKVMERSIMAFYKGEYDILVSTTIIENGIDLPKANTLIVIDADKLGLSTLYQLKGRVGRSDRLAYAYFTFKREKILSSVAFDRLNAIIEFTEMGSGIKIAMRDLEIRGAGNVLGAEQHGHMDKIGYELYSKILREEITGIEEKMPELDIRLSAFIPENYIESETMRMDAYKEIAEIDSLTAEKECINYLEEGYGKPPKEVINLINIAVIKLLASKIKAEMVTVRKEETSIAFDSIKAFSSGKLNKAVDSFMGDVLISMTNVPKLEFIRNESDTNEIMLEKVKKFLALIV